MRWAAALSQNANLLEATREACDDLAEQFAVDSTSASADLVFAFVSQHHEAQHDGLPELLERRLPNARVFGCSAQSILAGQLEIEERPGLALLAAQLPGVSFHGFHLEAGELPAADAPAELWQERIGIASDTAGGIVLLGDPFTSEPEALISGLDRSYPSCTKVGGIASGGHAPGACALFAESRVYRSGAVGLAFEGNLVVDSVVAQGCRPVGQPMFVTRCEGNLVVELDGRAPLAILDELFAAADPRDRALFQGSLFAGLEMRSSQMEYHQGDFLVRNLVGADRETGAVAIAAPLIPNQVLQFHLRDARTASEDLSERLERDEHTVSNARAALLFSCLGRGRNLYGVPNHDSELFSRYSDGAPLAGFFGNGEIGPVQQRTFLHGYTSAFGLFRPREQAAHAQLPGEPGHA